LASVAGDVTHPARGRALQIKSADEASLALRAEGVRTANGDGGVRQANIDLTAKALVKSTRKPQKIARGPAFPESFGARAEASSFSWNYGTQNRYAERWF
jgi:hypothetical protein